MVIRSRLAAQPALPNQQAPDQKEAQSPEKADSAQETPRAVLWLPTHVHMNTHTHTNHKPFTIACQLPSGSISSDMRSLVQLVRVSMSSSWALTFRSPRCLQTQDSSTWRKSSSSLLNFSESIYKGSPQKVKTSTLKRKLNPIIRYEGGRKFFFPVNDNTY